METYKYEIDHYWSTMDVLTILYGCSQDIFFITELGRRDECLSTVSKVQQLEFWSSFRSFLFFKQVSIFFKNWYKQLIDLFELTIRLVEVWICMYKYLHNHMSLYLVQNIKLLRDFRQVRNFSVAIYYGIIIKPFGKAKIYHFP